MLSGIRRTQILASLWVAQKVVGFTTTTNAKQLILDQLLRKSRDEDEQRNVQTSCKLSFAPRKPLLHKGLQNCYY